MMVVATGALRDYRARPLEGKAPGPAQPPVTLQSQCQWRAPSDERERTPPKAGAGYLQSIQNDGGHFQAIQTETAVA